MILTISSEETVDTDNLSVDGLRDLVYRMGEDIDSIEYQIETARVEARSNGNYADGQWYAKAQYALRRKRKTVDFAKQIMGERRRNKNIAMSNTLSSVFVDVARESLSEEEFSAILEDAKHLYHKSEEED
jgi:hypothetical protein